MTKFVIAVPFDGEEDVFKLRASPVQLQPSQRPRYSQGELRLIVASMTRRLQR